jgi:hypothetical protein
VYSPVPFEKACTETPVEMFRIVIAALGITAFEGSVIVPDRIAPATCPKAAFPTSTSATTTANRLKTKVRIFFCPSNRLTAWTIDTEPEVQ